MTVFDLISLGLLAGLTGVGAHLAYRVLRPRDGYSDIVRETLTQTDTPGLREAKPSPGAWSKIVPQNASATTQKQRYEGEKLPIEQFIRNPHPWLFESTSGIGGISKSTTPELYYQREKGKAILVFPGPIAKETVFENLFETLKNLLPIEEMVDVVTSNNQVYTIIFDSDVTDTADTKMKAALDMLELYEEIQQNVKVKGVAIKPRRRYPLARIEPDGIVLDFSSFKKQIMKEDLVKLVNERKVNSAFQPSFPLKKETVLDKHGKPVKDKDGNPTVLTYLPDEGFFVSVKDIVVNRTWKIQNLTTIPQLLGKGENFGEHFNGKIAEAIEPCIKQNRLAGEPEMFLAGQSLLPSYSYKPHGNKQPNGFIYIPIQNNPHGLIIGQTRSGKTQYGRGKITLFKTCYPETQFYFYDGKGSGDWNSVASFCSDYSVISGAVDDDVKLPRLAFVLDKMQSAQRERNRLFAELSRKVNEANRDKPDFIPVDIGTIYDYRKYSGEMMPHIFFVIEEANLFFNDIGFKEYAKVPNSLAHKVQSMLQQAGSYGIHFWFLNQYASDVAGGIPESAKKNVTFTAMFNMSGNDAKYCERYTKDAEMLTKMPVGKCIIKAAGIQDTDSGIDTPQASFPFIGQLAQGVALLNRELVFEDDDETWRYDSRESNFRFGADKKLLPQKAFDDGYIFSLDGSRPETKGANANYALILRYIEGGIIRASGANDTKRHVGSLDVSAGSEGTNPILTFGYQGENYGLCLYRDNGKAPSGFGFERDMESCRRLNVKPFVVSFEKKFKLDTELDDGTSALSHGVAVFCDSIEPLLNELTDIVVSGRTKELEGRDYLGALVKKFAVRRDLEATAPKKPKKSKDAGLDELLAVRADDIVIENVASEAGMEMRPRGEETLDIAPAPSQENQASQPIDSDISSNQCAVCGTGIKPTSLICLAKPCQDVRQKTSRKFKKAWEQTSGDNAKRKELIKLFLKENTK